MKINDISTRQFAGVRNKNIKLNDGLNILVGRNEAGKSTLIELIYQVLYRSSDLDKRKDKDFYKRFMPSGSKGDVVDAKMSFTTKDGDYVIVKRWGERAFTELVDPNGGIIANEDIINEVINGELIYKRGLYDDVVFASQKNQANVVEHILKKLDKKAIEKQDLVSIITSEGMSSTGGVDPEDIEKVIQEKIDALSGHWDFELDGPEKRRGIENPWARDVGRILEVYYKLATLEDNLRKTEVAEKAIDNDNRKILEGQEILAKYISEKEEYERYAEVIATYNSNKKLKSEFLNKKTKVSNDLEQYPKHLKDLAKAIALKNARDAEEIVTRYTKIISKKKECDSLKEELDKMTPILAQDVKKVSSLESNIVKLRAKLSNLDLVASIKKLGEAEIQIKSVATGELLDFSDDKFEINETVEITIPNVMTMVIAAKGIDIDEIKAEIVSKEAEMAELLAKSHSKDLEDMQAKRDEYVDLMSKADLSKKEYRMLVVDENLDELEGEYKRLKDKSNDTDDIYEKIQALCGRETIEAYIAKIQERIEQIEVEYGSDGTVDNMEKVLTQVKKELEKLESMEKDAESIPQKYLDLSDIDSYKEQLKNKITLATNQINDAKTALELDEKELGDVSPDDLRLEIDDVKIELNKRKEECRRWKHILTVLKTTKEYMSGESTMADVQSKFAEYLSVITNGRVTLNSMDENMDVDIQSGDSHLSYDILSEGTKDTIALAFRLAMLEHLFPDGGGLVVFDDPFTEMDEERTKQACSLVQKFADNNNQVIFVTCDNKYRNLLTGNIIEM